MRRFIAVILALLMTVSSVSLTSCNKNGVNLSESQMSTESDTQEVLEFADQMYDLEKVTDKLKMIGRATVMSYGVACDQTASGIAFNAYVKGEMTVTASCTADTYFTVYVDDVRLDERFFISTSEKSFTLQFGNELVCHEIRVVKQTEAQLSLCVLEGMTFYGALDKAPANKGLYIEVIGDSISCGYGNLCANGTKDPQLAKYEDGTQTYAYLAAEGLEADCSVVSCSGIGVVKGYRDFIVSDFYPLTCRYRSQTEKYDFNRVPSIVVINLGTNDANKGAKEDDFKATLMYGLIEDIRERYNADVPIVWCYGMMGSGCADWAKDAINELGGEANGLYAVELPRDNSGGNSHPSAEAQAEASKILIDFLKAKGLAD